MDKRSRSKKRVKRETEGRVYHSAHGALSTKKKYIEIILDFLFMRNKDIEFKHESTSMHSQQ